MIVAKQLPNTTTLSHLGSRALYLLATLPNVDSSLHIRELPNSATLHHLSALVLFSS